MLFLRRVREVEPVKAYCGKCQTKVEIKNPVTVAMPQGRALTRGLCPICGTRVATIHLPVQAVRI